MRVELPGDTVSRRDYDGWTTVEKETSTPVPGPVTPQHGHLPGDLQLGRHLPAHHPGRVPAVLDDSLLQRGVPPSQQPSQGFPSLAALRNTTPAPEQDNGVIRTRMVTNIKLHLEVLYVILSW